MPKVSVIIPVYEVENYVERCARSLFEQTLDDIEFIFVDDCTPDHSMEILVQIINVYRLRFAEMNYTVRTERMSANSGQAAVRRHGIQLATGDYVIHCDSDDWIDENMLKAMYDKAINDRSDVVVCDFQTHDGVNSLSRMIGLLHNDRLSVIEDMLFQNTAWSLCNKLFRSSLYSMIDGFPKDNMGEDMAITMRLLYYCNSISYVEQPLYYYFSNLNSITKLVSVEANFNKFGQFNRNFEIVKKFYSKKPEYTSLQKAFTWLGFSIKSMLDVTDVKCRQIWKSTFPYTEFKVLIYSQVNQERKKFCLRYIIKAYFPFLNRCKIIRK